MGDQSSIEWTDATWNPTTGCAVVSPGCAACYAARTAHHPRLARLPEYEGLTSLVDGRPMFTGEEVRLHPDRLTIPMRWTRPRRVFVDSMSDLFHPDVPADFVADVWATMAVTPRHTYQVPAVRYSLANVMIRAGRRRAGRALVGAAYDEMPDPVEGG